MQYQLNITESHCNLLRAHLFPGDGKEAVAIVLCGRATHRNKTKLMVHEVHVIPYSDCIERTETLVHWKTEIVKGVFEKAHQKKLSVLKIHSHPTGYPKFSETDDISDAEFFASTFGWVDDEGPHASAVMLPTGEIFGRVFLPDLKFANIDRIQVVGDEVQFYPSILQSVSESGKRTAQAFGNKTYSLLNNLTVAVVGCSGTGSIIIEQLVRLGVGHIVLVDPDRVEEKNLNRILNTTILDALAQRLKVEVIAEGIAKIGLKTKVTVFSENLYDSKDVLIELAQSDFIFGCMDTVDGRYLLNQLATFYLIPYIDVGVKLEADGHGGITKICGSAHYLQPGKSSLLSRGLYSLEDLKAAGQLRKNPDEYAALLKKKYIKNINVERPAVISVNMLVSSIGVNEFLNRIHSYKSEAPKNYAITTIDLTENYLVSCNEDDLPADQYLLKKVGRGNMIPFLDLPELNTK